MPQFVEKHKTRQQLEVDEGRLADLRGNIETELEDFFSGRRALDAINRECLKMYNGVPKMQTRDIPIPNAPNIEVTIGAIASDVIYAQALDLIFSMTPLVTVRPKPKYREDQLTVDTAKALQRFVNHLATAPDMNFRFAFENALLDDVQLGTGGLYVPFVKKKKKTKTAKVLWQGPKFYAIPLEDIIVPLGSSQGLQETTFFGVRYYYTQGEVMALARENGWDLRGMQPLHSKDWVRSTREVLGRQMDGLNRRGTLIDIIYLNWQFDIDGDGLDEDLLVVWNHSGRSILYYNYNPMDSRPGAVMNYQKQAHLFFGLGVLQMLQPYEEKLSDVHNYSTLNILLANSRMWGGSSNLSENLQIIPGRYIPMENPNEDFKGFEMADVYNSIWQDQLMTMQLANHRVGINDVSQGGQIPSRTPGITAMSFLQQVNRRFTPAFDSMRLCAAEALRQGCYRCKEQLLSGNQKLSLWFYELLGPSDGNLVINVLKRENFEEHVDMELTASSASINQEADKQNAIMLTNILGQYYQRTLQLVMLAANPETPPEVASIAKKIADSAGELIDRTIRTFDQVRDPGSFIIHVEEELNKIEATSAEQQGLMQLMSLLGQQQEPLQLGMGGGG